MKQVLGLLLAFVLLLGMMPVTAYAEGNITNQNDTTVIASGFCGVDGDNLTWALSDNGLLTIDGKGAMEDYKYIYSNRHWSVNSPWNTYRDIIQEVCIREGVTTIGNYAFYEYGIDQVIMSDTIITIGKYAFQGSGLTSVIIPNSVTSIDDNAFAYCLALTSVTISNGLSYLGEYAFQGCEYLNHITLPVDYPFTQYAFRDCKRVKSIYYTYGISGVMPDRASSSSDGQFKVYPTNYYGFTLEYYCRNSLETIMFEEGITKIGDYAFMKSPGDNARSLSNVYLPSTVVSIGKYAFYGSWNLSFIEFPESLKEIGRNSFASCGVFSDWTKTKIPKSVTSIGSYAFDDSNLEEITFCGNAPSIESEAFDDITATAYYPEGNETWTKEVMQNYGGNITWVPYDPNSLGEAPNDPPAVEPTDPPCALEELTALDYLAFAQIAYLDFESDGTVKDCLTAMGYWDSYWDKDRNITYAQLCEHIAQWKVGYSLIADWSSINGFYAVPFHNDSGEAVLAYRGSVPPDKMGENGWDAYCDWVKNDLPMELGNDLGPQYISALAIYRAVEAEWGKDNIAVTGHSLGGAWADVASAWSGCKGVTFNAVSVLDTVYNEKPEQMGKLFRGVDQWNFVDHTNKYDVLAGMFESYWSLNRIKPYTAHESIYAATNIAGSHGLPSIVEKDPSGNLRLTETDPASSFSPFHVVSNHLSFTLNSVDLGTSRADTINKAVDSVWARKVFGGDGNDDVTGGILSDTLVGGRGNDDLDGSWLNDTYIYYKGDGWDYIYDVSGADKLYLYDFDESDVIEAVATETTIDITCNGSRIVSIYRNNREYSLISLNRFVVYVGSEKIDITELFNRKKYDSRIKIACPVDVQVLDSDGNVVYTLKDGAVGNHYTDYGNFYVYEEEGGGYGKVLDLVQGYSAKVVGVDTGTMDITYQKVENGELSQAQTMSDIPVSETFEGFLMEEEDGAAALKIVGDHNQDGVVNEEDGDHDWDAGIVTVEPSEYADGACIYTCTACGKTETRIIDNNIFTDVKEDRFTAAILWAYYNGITTGTGDGTTFSPEAPCTRKQIVTFLWRAAGNPEPKSMANPFVDVPSDRFEKAILWAYYEGITTGTGDGTTFSPESTCTRKQIVTFLWRYHDEPAPNSMENKFTDVKNDRFAAAILWAAEQGITTGTGNGTTFSPEAPCTRKQNVTFLYRDLTKPAED